MTDDDAWLPEDRRSANWDGRRCQGWSPSGRCPHPARWLAFTPFRTECPAQALCGVHARGHLTTWEYPKGPWR